MSGMATRWFLGMVIGSAMSAIGANCAIAQITPDGTLPNNSIVTPDGSTLNITGGTQAGGNLFHSFQQFSVPTCGTAYFNNATDIQNIFGRVTGGSVSNIDGIIRANGTANLFLINPSGIIFGQNASLNVGGSFVATTANAIQFGDRGFFSATNPEAPSPLLTVNPSALLFNQSAASLIQNSSVAAAGTSPAGFDTFGLRVPDGKSLLLVGGNVTMDGGRLNANGGRIELGGLAEAGTVALGVNGDNLSLRFPENVARADVSLTNQAGIYVTGAGGGNIAVNARNLEISGVSVLSGGIGQDLGTPETVAGDITLNATGEIKVAGTANVGNFVQLGSLGNGGNITIDSGSFSLRDGASLNALTFGQGDAGNVTVNARDAVSLANAYILSTVEAGGVGKGGNININAATLSLTDAAQLQTITREASTTQLAGRGDAGNVNVKVTGAVDIAGQKIVPSAIFSSVGTGTEGNAGNITIDSGSFSLRDGARLFASTSGQGNAGTIKVNATDFATISGKSSNFNSGLYVNSQSTTGTAGDIIVTSPRVTLDNTGTLNAQSELGNGGNINLNVRDLLLMRGSAQISTTAGTASAGGNGGNITINTPNGFIVSVPNENSDITANAFTGSGGRITIDSLDVFNFTRRNREDLVRELGTNDSNLLNPQRLQTNDITAFSQTNPTLSGQINVNTSGIEQNLELVELPTLIPDTSALVDTSCAAFDSGGSSFTITGRGGLPPNPDEFLSTDVVWTDERSPATTTQPSANKPTKPHSKPKAEPIAIVPATGWVFNFDKGEVTLISNVPNNSGLGSNSATCPTR